MDFPERVLEVVHFDEPALEFGLGQSTAHPKDGLFLYGPHSRPKKVKEIRVGVIGTTAGLAHFRTYLQQLKGRVEVPPPGKAEKKDRLHLASFPGLEEAFGITISLDELVSHSIDEPGIDRATRLVNLHEAVGQAVQLYVNVARRHARNDERSVDLWVLVVPEIIFERCRTGSKRTGLPLIKGDFGKKQKKRSDLPLLGDIVDHAAEEIFDDAPDFHRQIKAEFLSIAPTQLLRETTLAPESFKNKHGYPIRKTQDQATVAWNVATGLYYKTQPAPPWKLAGVRPGVCYVGLVYKNLPNDPRGHACCAAQMFLAEGDGVVFRGANGPWETGRNDFHLSADAARDLVNMVLETYADTHADPPNELFIHGQTYFRDDEWRALEAAAPKGTNVVGVRIGRPAARPSFSATATTRCFAGRR
ncbi:MAG TPA: hypothetical protein VGI95_16005 [Caulobacteraceae bacterium]|jgi:hypothetical protein